MGKAGQNSNLDILRSAAVLAVFTCHTLQVIAGCKPGEPLAFGVNTLSLGQIGVLIFFVHTCLVLMQSLERTGRGVNAWRLMRDFYIRRAFRIYPLSICLVTLSLVFSVPPNALGVAYRWLGAKWAIANLLLIQNLTDGKTVADPLWSLPFEVQMYLVLPPLFLMLQAPRANIRLALLYLVCVLLSLFHPPLGYVPCFLGGVVAYRLLGRVRHRLPAWLWCPAVLGTIAIFVRSPYSPPGYLKDVAICLFVALAIPMFRESGGATAAAAGWIAKYSYGIYLCHTPVLWLVYRKLPFPDWQRPVWVVIGTAALSCACYHAIEQPLIQAGKHLAAKRVNSFDAPMAIESAPAA